LEGHAHAASDDIVHLVDDSAGQASRNERSVRRVCPIRKHFAGDLQAGIQARGCESRRRWRVENQRASERGNGARNRVRELTVPRRHVVQSAVRFHVMHARALR